MALTCPERGSVMATLDTRYMKFFPEGVKLQRTVFRKRLHSGNLGESVYPKFTDKFLCPVDCLSTYLEEQKIGGKRKLTTCHDDYSSLTRNYIILYQLLHSRIG